MNKTYLEKQKKIKEENLKYDFLPSMLEIIEKPENKVSDIIIWLVLALIITAVVWAAFAKTDIAVTAQGSIMPKGSLVSVSSPYGGEIKELAVEEGQKVNRGDLLFMLDTSAEEESRTFLEYELSLLIIQQKTYASLKAYREKQQSEGENREEKQEKEQKKGEKEIEENAGLLSSKWDEYGIDSLQFGEYASTQNKEVTEGQIDELIAQRNLTVLQNLNSLEVKIKETEKDIEESNRVIEQKHIKAQTDGIITNMSVNSIGQLITAGTQVAYIIPENEETIFKAYVKSSDIEGLKIGDSVSVRIAALKDTPYDRMEGHIQRIGDVAVSIEGMGSVYRVDIALQEIPDGYLKIGEEGSCDILIGKRSVLNYFLEPFLKVMKDSLHEK